MEFKRFDTNVLTSQDIESENNELINLIDSYYTGNESKIEIVSAASTDRRFYHNLKKMKMELISSAPAGTKALTQLRVNDEAVEAVRGFLKSNGIVDELSTDFNDLLNRFKEYLKARQATLGSLIAAFKRHCYQ